MHGEGNICPMKINRDLTFSLLLVFSLIPCTIYSAPKKPADIPEKNKRVDSDSPSILTDIHDFFLPHYERRKKIFALDSQYYRITVEDDKKGFRHLVFNNSTGSQGIGYPGRPGILVSDYMKYMFLTLAIGKRSPRNVLFVGLGAGLMPMCLRHCYPTVEMDIVELDKTIPDIAKKYFDFQPDDSMDIIIDDGRAYLNRCNDKYDIIFIDAYYGDSLPFHLTTSEFFKRVKNALYPGGTVVMNIVADSKKMKYITSLFKTVNKTFRNTALYLTPRKTNFVLLASQNHPFVDKKMKEQALSQEKIYDMGFKLSSFIESRLDDKKLTELIERHHGIILTDDFAPVNVME